MIRIKTKRSSGLRSVDPPRDLRAIVDLIEIGFRNELDPHGQKMLKQMQRVARHSLWFNPFTHTPLEPTGFVWLEDGYIVGNLSLRRGLPSRNQGWLIGNVVVHPQYRGRRIGYALVQAALDDAAKHGARWVGLEVRQSNTAAYSLYEQFGFQKVGITQHLLRPAQHTWSETRLDARARKLWSTSHPKDNVQWAELAKQCYEREQLEVLEIRPGLYTFGGWEHKVELWFSGQREGAWLKGQSPPKAAVHIIRDRRHKFHLWDLLVQPETDEALAQETVARAFDAMQRARLWPVITIVPSYPPLLNALRQAGFHLHRRLVQMKCQV